MCLPCKNGQTLSRPHLWVVNVGNLKGGEVMFTEQINILSEQEKELVEEIATVEAVLANASTKLSLIRKGKKQLEKLQEQFDEQSAVSEQ